MLASTKICCKITNCVEATAEIRNFASFALSFFVSASFFKNGNYCTVAIKEMGKSKQLGKSLFNSMHGMVGLFVIFIF
jgi:hypothetical protein